MKPTVSVILPVFNGQDTINPAIDSILQQIFENIELIIVDDGSTDSSAEKINAFDDPRIRYIRIKHSGLAASLNIGITKSGGEYIARMDADDISSPDRIIRQVDYLEEHPGTDLVSCTVKFQGKEEAKGLNHYVDWQNNLLTHQDINLNRFVDSPLVHPTILARRSAFERYGHYSLQDGPEDFELWLRWLHAGARFHKIKGELYTWTDHPARLTRIHQNYAPDRFYKLKAKYFSMWFQNQFQDQKPEIWVIGTGRIVYQKSQWLINYGNVVEGFVDFKARDSEKRKIISYNNASKLNNAFFLSFVNDRLGRLKVHEFLCDLGLQEGLNFYMMA